MIDNAHRCEDGSSAHFHLGLALPERRLPHLSTKTFASSFDLSARQHRR